MTSALQKLLRKSPFTRIIASFHASQVEPLARCRFPLCIEVQRPLFQPCSVTEYLGLPRCNVIFPSFRLGWFDGVKKKGNLKMNKHE
ncbi:hypothetical protein JHK82_052907 [Glycine max]|uniref:Uncharacterized protein n=2 Tax=Glycine subgen. Soja TaxID=1462606 RepID=A0A0R0EJ99_SOYBN|nr:hypothetical protein JHK86_052760 [Glycine max]KAG4915291.1 hypothetical protein JHK87_052848 [Glycine soja]KAG4927127.1 hypothetical protein JHK85_053613 [Glycine max]KAG5082748.1 hypothetical protein JHK84_052786 [Glycine max]KAG5085510.1 hypothetical protein JHK82_052907 [Glycine max]